MKVLAIVFSLLIPILGFAKPEEQIKKERKYPGGWDEQDIQVQNELPATYKTPRKYYESKLLKPSDGRMPASHEE
jgi:hypothetical protein